MKNSNDLSNDLLVSNPIILPNVYNDILATSTPSDFKGTNNTSESAANETMANSTSLSPAKPVATPMAILNSTANIMKSSPFVERRKSRSEHIETISVNPDSGSKSSNSSQSSSSNSSSSSSSSSGSSSSSASNSTKKAKLAHHTVTPHLVQSPQIQPEHHFSSGVAVTPTSHRTLSLVDIQQKIQTNPHSIAPELQPPKVHDRHHIKPNQHNIAPDVLPTNMHDRNIRPDRQTIAPNVPRPKRNERHYYFSRSTKTPTSPFSPHTMSKRNRQYSNLIKYSIEPGVRAPVIVSSGSFVKRPVTRAAPRPPPLLLGIGNLLLGKRNRNRKVRRYGLANLLRRPQRGHMQGKQKKIPLFDSFGRRMNPRQSSYSGRSQHFGLSSDGSSGSNFAEKNQPSFLAH